MDAEEIAVLKEEPRLEVKRPMSRVFQLSPLYQPGDWAAAAWVANTVANRSAQRCSTSSASAAGRFFS